MRQFLCECGNTLFFGSSRCLRCKRDVGFDAERQAMTAIQPGGPLRRCENGVRHAVCNWIVPVFGGRTLCPSCRLNRTIPDLRDARNVMLWGRMELAKRRLIYTLLGLGMKLPSKTENPKAGLAFDIVSTMSNPTVTTGHLNGVITVNLEEADDTYRQIHRQQLGENSRTLLGHFRHESGHYAWQRWLTDLPWEHPHRIAFRERFGNEWIDYAASLQSHYRNGAPKDWQQAFITPYAASHPWEDWAETWAHYLQIIEGLETCESLGIEVPRITLPVVQLPAEAGALPASLAQSAGLDAAFLLWLQRWISLSTALNEISMSLGEPALYPFVISARVAQKLRLIHHLAGVWGSSQN